MKKKWLTKCLAVMVVSTMIAVGFTGCNVSNKEEKMSAEASKEVVAFSKTEESFAVSESVEKSADKKSSEENKETEEAEKTIEEAVETTEAEVTESSETVKTEEAVEAGETKTEPATPKSEQQTQSSGLEPSAETIPEQEQPTVSEQPSASEVTPEIEQPTPEFKPEVTPETTPDPAPAPAPTECKHNYVFSYWFPAAPTCAADGSAIHHCSKCGEPKTIRYEPTGQHDFQNPVVTVPGDCISPSEITYYCTVCGGEEHRVGEIDPNNHPFDIVDGCCAGCWVEIEPTQTPEPAPEPAPVACDHDYVFSYWFPAAPTCAADGSAIHHCSKCGDPKTVHYEPTGQHEWQDPVETSAGTCLYASSLKYTCGVCGGEETRDGEMNPNNHPAEIVIDGVCLGCYAKVN